MRNNEPKGGLEGESEEIGPHRLLDERKYKAHGLLNGYNWAEIKRSRATYPAQYR